MPVSVAK